MKRFVDCLCWGQHLDDCPNYVSLAERRAFYASVTLTAGGDAKQAPGASLSGAAPKEDAR